MPYGQHPNMAESAKQPAQAALQNPADPSTHVATPSSPTHLPSMASHSEMDSSMTPSSPGSPLSPLVGFSVHRNVVPTAPSLDTPSFQHQLPNGLTPAREQCITEHSAAALRGKAV